MKKTYGIMLTEIRNKGDIEGYENLYIRFYDSHDAGQIPSINSFHVNIKEYKDKSKFDYVKSIQDYGGIIPFSLVRRNYNYSKKEFRIIYKIIKAFLDDEYYSFWLNRKRTQYTIVGSRITILERNENKAYCGDIYLYDLKSLLNFFTLEFKRNSISKK